MSDARKDAPDDRFAQVNLTAAELRDIAQAIDMRINALFDARERGTAMGRLLDETAERLAGLAGRIELARHQLSKMPGGPRAR